MSMRREVNDLRILKLAEMYEISYERFVAEVARRIVRDEEVREKLMQFLPDGEDHHARIVQHMTRLNAKLAPEDHAAVEIGALEDVLEVELAARKFYAEHADQLHDPQIVQLFRELASAEEKHVRLARQVLDLALRKAGRIMPSASGVHRMGHLDKLTLMMERVPDVGGAEGSRLVRHVDRAGAPDGAVD